MIYTNPLESDTRLLIDRSLENLGYNAFDDNGKFKHIYTEQPKYERERIKLKGKRPDYVIYSAEKDKPIIVIEAKKKGENIDKALEQGKEYAKALGAPTVFATDGVFCKSYNTVFDKTPLLNGEEVDEFIREALALKYINKWEVNTVSDAVRYDRGELIKVFGEANAILRAEGLRAGIERFGEFANILFLKLISENEEVKAIRGEESNLKIASIWSEIKNQSKYSRLDYINNIAYKTLNLFYGTDIFTPLQIRNVDILNEIMHDLDPLHLTDVDSDIKGDAFEYFLRESTASGNDLGEYFTPRNIVKTMVRLANPQIGEKVYDPFCGTGGFLIESFRYIDNKMARTSSNNKILRENTIFGNEITNTARITKMNMILAGDGHSNIEMKDSLANPVEDKYDIVITNMPYSQKTRYGNKYDIPTNNGDSICMQHCLKAIDRTTENGRIVAVVPEGFLFRKDLSKTREYLMENANLRSVISLPQGVFLPYTGVKTNILYFDKVKHPERKKISNKKYWYFNVNSDGYSLDNHRRKLDTPSDLIKYEEYRKLDDDQENEMLNVGFMSIPYEKIKNNDFILLGNRYTKQNKSNTDISTVKLKEVATLIRGISFGKKDYLPFSDSNLGVVTTKAAQKEGIVFDDVVYVDKSFVNNDKLLKNGDILISLANSINHVGRITYVPKDFSNLTFGAFMGVVRCDKTKVVPEFLYYILNSNNAVKYFRNMAKTTTNISNLTFEDLENYVFPLPSIPEQERILGEIIRYQKIADGAKLITENYEPKIVLNENYPSVKIGDICDLATGSTPPTKNRENYDNGDIKWLVSGDIHKRIIYDCEGRVTEKGVKEARLKTHKKGSVMIALNGQGKTRGTVALLKTDATCNQSLISMRPKDEDVSSEYLYLFLRGMYQKIRDLTGDKQRSGLNMTLVKNIKIPLPPIEKQNELVDIVRKESMLVENNNELIEIYTKKISDIVDTLFA